MPPSRSRQKTDKPDPARVEGVADRLHSAAIHLLRRLRTADAESGLTAPRLSALSVLVFGGRCAVGALAEAEQVRVPTMTRLVQGLEKEGLVACEVDASDRRRVIVRATAAGQRVLREGRARRVKALAERLAGLSSTDMELMERAAKVLESLEWTR